MSDGKKGFLLYLDYERQFSKLNDAELGQLLRAIYVYEKTGQEPDLDGAVGMAFGFVSANLDRDRAAWEKSADASRKNGLSGGRPRTRINPQNPVGFPETQANPDEPAKPVIGTGNVTGIVTATGTANAVPPVSTDVLTSPAGEDGAPETRPEPRGGSEKRQQNAGFARFWEAYPSHKAKANALKAWNKLKPDEHLTGKMLAAIAWQKRTDQWQRGIIPLPATWLNGRRWEDEEGNSLPTRSDQGFPIALDLRAPPGEEWFINGVEMSRERFQDEVRYAQGAPGVTCGFDDERHFWCRRDGDG